MMELDTRDIMHITITALLAVLLVAFTSMAITKDYRKQKYNNGELTMFINEELSFNKQDFNLLDL